MQSLILKILMPIIMGMMEDLLSAENLKKYGGGLFKFIKDAVRDSETDVDDKLVLPVIEMLEEQLGISAETY